MGTAASAYEAPVFNGTPGKRWRNTTGKIQFQLICDLHNSCGTCLQFHMAVGMSWPIPFHRRCRCHQVLILPDAFASPFVDFRKILEGLPHDQQAKAVGVSLYEMLRKGVIQWSDAVTPTRVRDLQEVVWKKRLTVAEMVKAGVKPRWAQQAHDRAHSKPAALLQSRRADLLAKIRGAGMSDQQVRQAVREGLAQRFVVSGPSGMQRVRAKPTGGGGVLFLGSKEVVQQIKGTRVADLLGGPSLASPASKADLAAGGVEPIATLRTQRFSPEVDAEVRETMEAISKLHNAPPGTPTIDLKIVAKQGAHGECVRIGRRLPDGTIAVKTARIEVDPTGSHKAMTLAHEFGHFMDYQMPGGDVVSRGSYASLPLFSEWAKAVKSTPTYQSLAKAHEASPNKHLKYLLQDDELWARSYAQWVATRSDSPFLKQQLAAEKSAKQWGTREFTPIAEAIDAIFATLGLLR